MYPKLYFLNHSGFLLELEDVVFVFDFYTDPANVLAEYSESSKPVVFFVSHDHPDHWNPEIMFFENNAPTYFILDSSCDSKRLRQTAEEVRRKVIFVDPHNILQDELAAIPSLLRVYVFDSTDKGSSFLVVTETGSFIHLGDLNDWDWQDEDSEQMEADFKAELTRMAEIWSEITQDEALPAKAGQLILSFVPVDKRLEEMALKGALTFLEYLPSCYLAPMHLNGGEELPGELASILSQQDRVDLTQVLDLTVPGQMISLDLFR